MLNATVLLMVALFPLPKDNGSLAPLVLAFERYCGLPPERDQAYESRTGVYHVHFQGGNRFDRIGQASIFSVKSVSGRLAEPLSFRLTGMPNSPDHPLQLSVGRETYLLDPIRHDKKLFRVASRGGALHIEFTREGMKVLKPGARFSFVELTW